MSPHMAWSSNSDLREKRLLNGGFYKTIRLTLLTSRFVGVMPISGLTNHSSKLTRCTWKSFYSLIYVPRLVVQVLLFSYLLVHLIRRGISMQKLFVCKFMGTYIIESIITLRLCIKWRTMITEVEAIERKLPPVNKPRKAVFVANLTMLAIQLCWAVNHWLYLTFIAKMTLLCYLQPDDSDLYIKSYLLVNYSWFYDEIPFSYFSGVILQVFQAQASFISNIITVLVAITSMYLTNRFQTFNRIFFQRQHKSRHSKPSWMELQMYYARLTRLAHIVNDYIHPFVFVTFWSDLFFISFQTYYTLNKLTLDNFYYNECYERYGLDTESVAYCVYFFIFTVLKITLVWFLAAELHETSRKPLNALYTVSSKAYTVEMQRLMTQIYRNKICLTGLNLFDITRGTILTIMATILTYELVLLQI